MILLVLSFVAGVLTIFAPCTLPLLPVIIGSSLTGEANNKKAFVIATSLGLSVIIFTLLLKVSTLFINIPQSVWEIISGVIIILFGLTSLFPGAWERLPFMAKLNVSSNRLMTVGYKKDNFWGNVIIGASLGPVFSTCSPTYFVVLATVLPQSLTLGIIDLLAYAIGLAGMLMLVSFLGQKIVGKLGWLSDTHGRFRRALGAIFIILGIFIMFGIDKNIEAKILTSGFFDITTIEQKLLELNDSSKLSTNNQQRNDQSFSTSSATSSTSTESTIEKNPIKNNPLFKSMVINLHGPQAPEIVGSSGFINTDGQPIKIGQFRGKKVVLLDIWTYSCINCQRTLPYVTAWYSKYKDQGLEVIGIHTPEFAFEKVQKNVEDAVKRFGITYPVVMDNDYATWNAYGNQYWPRKYLINQDGEIIYDHIGEGDYDKTELAIQQALALLDQSKGQTIDVTTGTTKPANAVSSDDSKIGSPETYFGASRNKYFGSGQPGKVGEQVFSANNNPNGLPLNTLYLDGRWNIQPEYAEIKNGGGEIVYRYNSKNVYFVASSDIPVGLEVLIDGNPISPAMKGKDVEIKQGKGLVNISNPRLYEIVNGTDQATHTLELIIPQGGLKAFTFTFG